MKFIDKSICASQDDMKGVIEQYTGRSIITQKQQCLGKKRNTKIKKDKKKNKHQLLIVSPLQFLPLQENRMFFLYGGVILPCDFDIKIDGILIADKQAFSENCQKLVSIDKRANFLTLTYDTQFRGLRNFQFLIDIYMSKGKEMYYRLAQTLEQFQRNIISWAESAEISKLERLQNVDQYLSDIEEFNKYTMNEVDKLDQSKFFMYGTVAYNYSTNELEQRTIGFSHGLISLLGTDPDQFAQINLRCGQPIHSFGENIIEVIIASLIPLSSGDFIEKDIQVPANLITLDGFTVPCVEIRSYRFPKSQEKIKHIEMGLAIIQYEISVSSLRQLLTLRRNNEETQFNFVNDHSFEYSMNSQLFLEQFYPNAFPSDFFRCKFRKIDQKKPEVEVPLEFLNDNSQVNLTSISLNDSQKTVDMTSQNVLFDKSSIEQQSNDYEQLMLFSY